MKIFKGTLELPIPIIVYFLIFLFLGIFINNKTSIIIVAIMLLIIGILFLKNEYFYEKYIKLLFDKENYNKYINDSSNAIKEKDRHDYGVIYLVFSILTLIDSLHSPKVKLVFDIETINLISTLIVLLLNSIIGTYFYRKFKNSKQYIFSFFLMISILIFNIYNIYHMISILNFNISAIYDTNIKFDFYLIIYVSVIMCENIRHVQKK